MVSHAFTRSLAYLGLLTLSAACVPDFETDLSALRAPRLLAIASNPAETQGKKPATLTALVAVPEGETAPEVDWTLCLSRKPLTELGPVNPLCLEADDGSGAVASLGRGESVDTVLDQDVCKLFGPLRPSAMAGEPAGRPVDPDVTGGFYQPVVANLDGATSLGSIRIDCDPANLNRDDALEFRARYRVNENPKLSTVSISSGGSDPVTLTDAADAPTEVRASSVVTFRAEWDACPVDSVCGDGLCTANEDSANCADDCADGMAHGCTGAESYVWYDRERYRVEPRREGITVAWYASKGSFELEQTGLDEDQTGSRRSTSNSWRPGSAVGSATVWVVARDTRGGVSWRVQHFTIVK
ncbi:MAG TPA: hypothetical protein VHP33_15930 [Polyangiaceae bacterium]|nr:hypothetical protein [Polyangiaceae bacterium]